MSNDPSIRRRRGIKLIGAIGIGAVVPVNTSSAERPEDKTGFDPTSRRELEAFLSSYLAKLQNLNKKDSEEFQIRIKSQLSDAQKAAIASYISNEGQFTASVSTSSDGPSVGISGITVTETYDYTLRVEIDTPIGKFDAYNYTHKIEWDIEGGDVVDVQSIRGGYKTYSHLGAVYWSFLGDSVSNVEVNPSYCEATRSASFRRNAISGSIASTTDTCQITLLGDDSGYGAAPRILENGEPYNE